MNLQLSYTKTHTPLTDSLGNECYSDKTLAKRNENQNEERQDCLVPKSFLPASLEMEPACETPVHPRRG